MADQLMKYTCKGPERGECGVWHDTPQECVAHILADHAANGKTDREGLGEDGKSYMLFSDYGSLEAPILKPHVDVAGVIDALSKKFLIQ